MNLFRFCLSGLFVRQKKHFEGFAVDIFHYFMTFIDKTFNRLTEKIIARFVNNENNH